MKYIIIEKFRKDKIKQLYRRFEKQGRLLPEGLLYLDSWIDEKVSICYQLMETHSADCIKEWIAKWDDLADFEVIPVINSARARQLVLGKKINPALNIRFGTVSDCRNISMLLATAFAEFKTVYTPKAFEATTVTAAGIESRMKEGPVWVAQLEDEIVGTVSVLSKGMHLYIRGMGVHPRARGMKVGFNLLKTVEEYAKTKQFEGLILSTTPYLKRAIALYEKFGFRIVNLPPFDLYQTPLMTMVKDLK